METMTKWRTRQRAALAKAGDVLLFVGVALLLLALASGSAHVLGLLHWGW